LQRSSLEKGKSEMGKITALIVMIFALFSFVVISSLPVAFRPNWLFVTPILIFMLSFVALER
jgi:hypothetical protein